MRPALASDSLAFLCLPLPLDPSTCTTDLEFTLSPPLSAIIVVVFLFSPFCVRRFCRILSLFCVCCCRLIVSPFYKHHWLRIYSCRSLSAVVVFFFLALLCQPLSSDSLAFLCPVFCWGFLSLVFIRCCQIFSLNLLCLPMWQCSVSTTVLGFCVPILSHLRNSGLCICLQVYMHHRYTNSFSAYT